MDHAQQQLRDIHAMLAAGQRCVRLERHSLLLFGGVGGFVSLVTESVITAERFPDLGQRATALFAWLVFWLGGASLLDHWLTGRDRRRRAETLPFAQAQITRAWWMLLSMGTLGSIAMFFYGGGAMIYALWIVLLGLGIYLFGLFSRPLIEWIGLATILLGVAGLAAGLPFSATRWLAAACFAVGMPLAGWLAARFDDRDLVRRGATVAAWLAVVTGPPLAYATWSAMPPPTAATVGLAAYQPTAAEQVVRLEPGTRIPVRLDLDSTILKAAPDAGLDLTLDVPVEVAMRDGNPDGRYRLADGAWHGIREGLLQLRIEAIEPCIEAGQPVLRAKARVLVNADRGATP